MKVLIQGIPVGDRLRQILTGRGFEVEDVEAAAIEWNFQDGGERVDVEQFRPHLNTRRQYKNLTLKKGARSARTGKCRKQNKRRS